MLTSFWEKKISSVFGFLLIALGFCLSISVYASDIIVFCLVFLWFIKGRWVEKWVEIKSSRFSIAIILFLHFYLLGLSWGSYNVDAFAGAPYP